MTVDATRDRLLRRVKILSEQLWGERCQGPDVSAWLNNFKGSQGRDISIEQLHALHLLSSVVYFGEQEIRVLLRSMYRDLFRYPIIQRLRKELGGTKDATQVNVRFQRELMDTRFVAVGGPSESGAHLLYSFRQENNLPISLFASQEQVLNDLSKERLKRVVFIDDMCGSGRQTATYSRPILRTIRSIVARQQRRIEVQYLVLFGTSFGIGATKRTSIFDKVAAVSEIDDTYKTFDPASLIFLKPVFSITWIRNAGVGFRRKR